jgi:hypothetical protein
VKIYRCIDGYIYINICINICLFDEKFGDTDIEKGPETIIGPGIFKHVFRKEFMWMCIGVLMVIFI